MSTVEIDRELLEELLGFFKSETERLRVRQQDKTMKQLIAFRENISARVNAVLGQVS